MREITLDELRKMMQAAREQAQAFGNPSAIAIVDAGGHLRAFERPENGRIGTVDIAIKKAWTSIAFKRTTEAVRQIMMPDAYGFGLQHTDPRICMVTGGVPIVENGEYLGGIGASGGSIEQDVAVCLAGLRAVGFSPEFTEEKK